METNKNWPKISIITPVLNAGKTLEKTILSVIAQQYPNLEWIILDGKSTDNTLDIIKKYSDYITYWHSFPDGNPTLAINEGIARASGDLIVQLMGDDYYEPETLLKVGQALLDHPDADMITCGGRIIFYDNKQKTYRVKRVYTTEKDLALTFENICFDISAICCRFVRKSLYEKIGDYIPADTQGKHLYSADKEFLLHASLIGAKNILIDHLGHNYLSHDGSTTFGGNRKITARLYVEHIGFAKMYLARNDLTLAQRKTLQKWYCHQSARLVMYQLAKGNFAVAFKSMQQDIPLFKLKWFINFLTAPFDFWWRRSLQFLKNKLNIFSRKDFIYGKES